MNKIFYFKPKVKEVNEYYLRFNADSILFFKEKENTISSALDIYLLMVKGHINNDTIEHNDYKVMWFINTLITPKLNDRLVVLDKDKLEYCSDSKFLYVDLDYHKLTVNNFVHTVEYLSKDSDRRSEKESCKFKIDINNGIYVNNGKYLLYIHGSLFSNYHIKMI